MNDDQSKSESRNKPQRAFSSQSGASVWDAVFLKRAEQTAFSTLWVAVVLGCIWYFVTERGFDPVDIDEAPTRHVQFLVEINSASKHEFACLPGIGAKTASRITAWREQNGPFETIESLVEVPGVSPKMLEKLRPWLHLKSQDELTQR